MAGLRSNLESERQVQSLGIFVHGVLAGLHGLGAVYNAKRKNWLDVLAHSAALAYDTWAVVKHTKAVDKLNKLA